MILLIFLFMLQLPGVSYRGRIMVEIDVNIGSLPTERHEDIKLVEQKKLTVSGYVAMNCTYLPTHTHTYTSTHIHTCAMTI